jgi:hypothetical protein
LAAPPAPVSLLAMATWFGLATGLLELALLIVLKSLHDPSPGFFRMNRNVVWMVPAFNLAAFGACGLLLGLVARLRGRPRSRLAPSFFTFLACLTLMLAFRSLYAIAGLLLAAGIARRLGPRIAAHPEGFRRLVRGSLPALIGLAALLVGLSYGRERLEEIRGLAALPAAPSGAPNVLLIVLDTVRADHLSLYGYERDTTPNLKRLARKGIRFDQAQSTASWTLPSHASMLTGRWPHEMTAGLEGPLDGTHRTLAEALRARGYATAGFVANTTYCSAETGLNRGFLHYEDHDRTVAAALDG